MNQIFRAGIYAAIFLANFLLTSAIICYANLRPTEETTATLSLPNPPLVNADELDTLLLPEAIPAIDDPQFEPVANAQDIGQDERIIAVEINGDARAYPFSVLRQQPVMNDNLAGVPILIWFNPTTMNNK